MSCFALFGVYFVKCTFDWIEPPRWSRLRWSASQNLSHRMSAELYITFVWRSCIRYFFKNLCASPRFTSAQKAVRMQWESCLSFAGMLVERVLLITNTGAALSLITCFSVKTPYFIWFSVCRLCGFLTAHTKICSSWVLCSNVWALVRWKCSFGNRLRSNAAFLMEIRSLLEFGFPFLWVCSSTSHSLRCKLSTKLLERFVMSRSVALSIRSMKMFIFAHKVACGIKITVLQSHLHVKN